MASKIYALIYNSHNYNYSDLDDGNEVWLYSTLENARRALRAKVVDCVGTTPNDLSNNANEYCYDNGETEYQWVIEPKLIDLFIDNQQ